ncbi:MAG: DUF3772 domain-containing protein [Pseudomonadota bacterium]
MMRFLAALVLWLGLALASWAQDEMPDQAEWSAVTERAETVLGRGVASAEALEELRADLVDWRNRFAAAEDTNATRIAAIQAQIDALGPAPAEGETEAPGIAEQRAALQAQLNQLLLPVREAQAAFAEADALVAETDRLIDASRTEAVLRRDASPLNPTLWPPAIAQTAIWFGALGADTWAPFATPTARAVWLERWVEIGGLALLALVLLWRSGVWLRHLRHRLAPFEAASPAMRLALMMISFARLILPVLGLAALMRILTLMGAQGLRIDILTWLVPTMGFVILSARWIGYQVFPARETAPAILPVAPERRREGRFHAIALGVLFALGMLVEQITQSGDDLATSRPVLHFVLLVLAGLTMTRLGQLFLSEGRKDQDDSESIGLWAQVMRLTGRVVFLVGIAGPLVAALGYVNLGLATVWPTAFSLGLIAIIGIAQTLVSDIYAALSGDREGGREALIPTLIGLVLAMAALPLFALIWGVRPSTLGEWWAAFLRGFRVGETRISPENFLIFAIVLVIGILATRLLKGVLRSSVLPKTRLDAGGTNAILSGTGYVGITLAALLAITTAGIDLGGLAIVAGALSVGVGFGLQTIVQNFVSGIILLIERPIKIGDWINVNGMDGFVRQISVRSTRIETFDRQDVIIPNADLISGVVTNYTLGNSAGRLLLPVGVAYGTDTRKVDAILREIVEAHPMVVLNPPPLITFEGFGADSLDFLCRIVLRDILFIVTVRSELNHQIAARFTEEGIEIPFAQRDVWLRNPETLHAPEAT